MIIIDSSTGLKNITTLTQVHTVAAPKSSNYNARIQIGDDANPIAGNGTYQLRIDINGLKRDEYIAIASGITKSFFLTPDITVYGGEILTLSILGLSGDTNVRVTTIINDVVPTVNGLISGFSGMNGEKSVWTEEEKSKVIKNISSILSLLKSMNDDESVLNEIGSTHDRLLTLSNLFEEKLTLTEKIVHSLSDRVDGVKALSESNTVKLYNELSLLKRIFRESINGLKESVDQIKINEALKGIELLQDILIKSAPTEVLESLDQ